MERSRLDIGFENLERRNPDIEQSRHRHHNARTYMHGQAEVLDTNIAAMEQALIQLIQPPVHNDGPASDDEQISETEILTLSQAYDLLSPSAQVSFTHALAYLTDTPASENNAEAFNLLRRNESEEDLWALFVGLAFLTPATGSSSPGTARLQQWFDTITKPKDSAERDADSHENHGDVEEVQHVMRLAKRISKHAHSSSGGDSHQLWASEEWADETFIGTCVKIVKQQSVALSLPSTILASADERPEASDGSRGEKRKRDEQVTRAVVLALEDGVRMI